MTEPLKELETVDHNAFERIWKIVSECGEQERHFNQLEHFYRALASTWLLATFGAVGFVLSDKFRTPPGALLSAPDPSLLIAGIGLAGTAGIMLLWVLDLLVYHRLLDSVFLEGLRLERAFGWLPRFRSNMWAGQQNRAGVLPKLVWFYGVTSGIVMTICVAASASWLRQWGAVWMVAVPALLAVAYFGSVVLMVRASLHTPLETEFQKLQPPPATTL